MLDYTSCNIDMVSVHHIGNKTNEEELITSKTPLELSDVRLRQILLKFFTQPFTGSEFYNFTFSNEDFNLNPLYTFTRQVFDDADCFHENSVSIARLLYELSVHPQIKSGDLFVVYFTRINIGSEPTEAIGIFKCENKQPFLKLDTLSDDFLLQCDEGINVDKLDKGCLILNIKREQGFKICIVDKSNKSIEAQYWRDSFLQLKPCSDDYHYTKDFLTITKKFITKQLPDDLGKDRAEQIDLLNRSVEYFKTQEKFDINEFENSVFRDKIVIESFREFDDSYREENQIAVPDNFGISPNAVKKQSRAFKSVLKLDRNFHIYIHGDRELIERGVDANGRKFYKIFYDNEE
jgi:hypothetical protein